MEIIMHVKLSIPIHPKMDTCIDLMICMSTGPCVRCQVLITYYSYQRHLAAIVTTYYTYACIKGHLTYQSRH